MEGRLLAPPFGEDGLKTDDMREAVDLLGTTPVGDQTGFVIIGPVDFANENAADVLLKTLEDHDEAYVQPILWASDLGNVSPTIQSRCSTVWCPSRESVEQPHLDTATKILRSIKDWDLTTLVQKVQECKGEEHELLGALSTKLAEKPTERSVRIWRSLRKILKYQNPKPIEIIAALLVSR